MQRLSRTASEMADALGYKTTLRLIRAFANRRLYVPTEIPDEHALHLIVGRAGADRLSATWGGKYIEIPDEQTVLLDLRNRRIVDEYRRSATVRTLARDYGVSPAMIRKILDAAGARVTEPTPRSVAT